MSKASKYFSDPKMIQLVSSAESGDAPGVGVAVHAGADPNQRGTDDATPLLVVLSSTANKEGILALMRNGADPNLPSTQHIAPIILAARAKDPELLKMMLSARGNPNLRGSAEEPLIWLSAMDGRWQNVQTLLDAGANIDAVNGSGFTTAMNLASIQQYDRVAWFIQKGANLRVVARSGATLAVVVALVKVPVSSPQYAWREKVIQLLSAQGIPVAPSSAN